MAVITDKEKLKSGLIIFRRGDVAHRNFYCRIKLPKEDCPTDRFKSLTAAEGVFVTPYLSFNEAAARVPRCGRGTTNIAGNARRVGRDRTRIVMHTRLAHVIDAAREDEIIK